MPALAPQDAIISLRTKKPLVQAPPGAPVGAAPASAVGQAAMPPANPVVPPPKPPAPAGSPAAMTGQVRQATAGMGQPAPMPQVPTQNTITQGQMGLDQKAADLKAKQEAAAAAKAAEAAAGKGAGGIDKLIEDFVRSQLSGKPDTSEQERLIRELQQDQTGKALLDQRASAGRGGMSASGGLVALEGDIRRKAAQSASQDILGARERASSTAYSQGLGAANLDIGMRNAASNALDADARRQALEAILGGSKGGASAGGKDNSQTAFDIMNGVFASAGQANPYAPEMQTKDTVAGFPVVPTQPPGSTVYQTLPDGTLYKTADGKIVKVNNGRTLAE